MSVQQDSPPRTGTTRKLWRQSFGKERGLLQIWTAIRDDEGDLSKETIKSNFFNYPEASKDAAEWALKKSEEGREVYFCAHLLSKAQRIKDNAAYVHALWGEIDEGGEVPNGDLKPTAVVESSPGRYHCYWRLSDTIAPTVAESLNKRMAQEIGADPSGFDLTQLLRVPGTVNHKYDEKPVVELAEFDADREYTLKELDALLPKLEEPKAEYEAEDTGNEPPVVLGPEALKVWQGEKPKVKDDGSGEVDKSATLMKIGRVLFDAGGNRRVVMEGVRERDVALGYHKYTGNRDGGEREYLRIWEKLKAEGRNQKLNITYGGGGTPKPEPEPRRAWPEIDEAAYRGLFGEAVELIEPHTEGDPVAVLMSVIVAFGNAMGRGPYVQVGATKHHTNLFCGLAGATSKGRKGSSWSPVKNIMHAADKRWAEDRVLSGLSSGEGLINEVRDPVQVPDSEGGMKTVDEGVSDKRLLVMEGELSQALKVMKREGNTLSPVLRNAWDGETLRTMVKHSPHRATNPHISILGHITLDELTRHLTETEMANGLANRFLWVLVKRSKSLPFGGEWHDVNVGPISRRIIAALEYGGGELRMTWAEDARELWVKAYERLTEDRPGMFGAVTARAEAQTLRLAMLYALADLSPEIRKKHVESALSVWEYAEESALYIFGDATGDPDADKVLAALKAGAMTRTDISSEVFGRNKTKKDLDRIREYLATTGRITVAMETTPDSDKRVETWRLA